MVIYNYLKKKRTATVGEIVDQVSLTQPTVSYHLKEMKHSGLLKSKKVGKEVHYSLSLECPHSEQRCVLEGLEFAEV
jgi:predicted transcriptional regulator